MHLRPQNQFQIKQSHRWVVFTINNYLFAQFWIKNIDNVKILKFVNWHPRFWRDRVETTKEPCANVMSSQEWHYWHLPSLWDCLQQNKVRLLLWNLYYFNQGWLRPNLKTVKGGLVEFAVVIWNPALQIPETFEVRRFSFMIC